MKKLLLVFFLLSVMINQAQVGINTDDPRALLDIKAANEVVSTNTPGVMVVGDGLLVPRVSTLLVDTDFPIEGLVVYLTASFEDTSQAPSVTYDPGFYVSYNSSWETFGTGGGSGGLEEITEGGNTGYRRADAVATNYGNIGEKAVDLSNSESASTTLGATGNTSLATGLSTTASGDYSTATGVTTVASGDTSTAIGSFTTASGFISTSMGNRTTASNSFSTAMGVDTNASGEASTAMGTNTTASGESSTAMGTETTASGINSAAFGNQTLASAGSSAVVGEFNTDYTVLNDGTNRLFIVGNGEDGARSDAFIVQKNGLVTAPSMSTTEIDGAGSEVLITKEWYNMVQSTVFQGIEQVTEDGNTGLRRSDAEAANFGDIGSNALDLSVSFLPSSTRGATGDLALATGGATTASGRLSTAMGRLTTASGRFSTAIGDSSVASGESSVAMGAFVNAVGLGEVVLGRYNTSYTPTGTTSDRAFVVGNGTSDAARSDAFIVQRNGLVTAPNLTTSQIDSGSNKALTTKEFTDENYIGRLPSGDTASRPTGASAPAFGTMRYNTQTGRAEVYVENSTDLPEGSTYVPGWVRI